MNARAEAVGSCGAVEDVRVWGDVGGRRKRGRWGRKERGMKVRTGFSTNRPHATSRIMLRRR